MARTLNPSELRRWVVRKLVAAQDATPTPDARLYYGSPAKKVSIDAVFPGDRNLGGQAIYCGAFRPYGSGTQVESFRGGAKRYEHDYELVVHLEVTSGLDPLASEDRAFELYDVLHDIVALYAVPYAEDDTTPLAYSAKLGNVTSTTGWIDNRGSCTAEASIIFHIDT